MNWQREWRRGRWIAESLGIAALFLLVAWLRLSFGASPGAFSMAWLPGGYAVAAAVLLGRRSLAGLWLGALIASLWALGTAQSPAIVGLTSAVIAVGVALQAFTAAHLLARWVTPDLGAFSLWRYVRFVVIASVACLIGPTIGVTTLALGGFTPWVSWTTTWQAWWLSDWLMVIIGSQLAITLSTILMRRPAAEPLAMAVVSLGLGVSVGVFTVSRSQDTAAISARFSAEAQAAAVALTHTLEEKQKEAEAVASLYAITPVIKREQFQAFAAPHLTPEHAGPGLLALGWAPVVAASERATFEAENAIRELGPDGQLGPARAREAYTPLQLVAPADRAPNWLGLDLGANPDHQTTLAQARDTGEPMMTAPFTLQTNDLRQQVAVIVNPIYRLEGQLDSVASRRANLLGFAVAILDPAALTEQALLTLEEHHTALNVFDLAAPAEMQLVHQHRREPANPDAAPLPAMGATIDLPQLGRPWRVVAMPTTADVYALRSWTPWWALAAGLAFTALLAAYLSHRQQAEAGLRASEARYRAVLAAAPDAMLVVDANARIILSNAQSEVLFGCPPETLIGQPVAAFLPGRGAAPAKDAPYRLEDSHETLVRRQDGREVPVELRVRDFKDGRVMAIRDITAQLAAAQQLRASEARFRQLAENIEAVFWIFDTSPRRLVYLSPAYEAIWGRSLVRLQQSPASYLEYILEEDRPVVLAARAREEEGQPTDFEYRIVRPDGSQRWIWERSFPITDDAGALVRTAGLATDITASKQAALQLKERESFLDSVVRSAPGYIATFNLAGYLTYLNRQLGHLDEAGLRRTHLADGTHPDHCAAVLSAFERAIATQTPQRSEHQSRTPEGVYHWFDVIFSPMVADGEVTAVTASAYDINDRKLIEAEARARQAALEKVIQLGKQVTAITDPDQCRRAIHLAVKDSLGFDRVGLFLYHHESGQIQGVWGVSRTGEVVNTQGYSVPAEAFGAWQPVLTSPTAVVVTDDYQATYNPPPSHEMYGVHQHVALAVWAGEKPVAVLTVDNLFTGREMASAEIEALRLFAGYAGLALENARLNADLEQRVRARTAEARDLYDNAPTGYHSLDADGRIVLINQTELNWLGYTREEVVGVMHIKDLLAPASHSIFTANFARFKTEGQLKGIEMEFRRKNGSILPVLLHATAVYDADGQFVQTRSTIFDITERKQAERALRASEDRLNFLLARTPAIIFTSGLSIEEPITFISDSVRDVLGYEPDQYREHPDLWPTLIHPDDMATLIPAAQVLFEQGRAIWDCRVRRADGEYRWLSIGASLIHDAHGQPAEIVGYAVDISAQKRAEDSMRHSETQLRQSRDGLRTANLALERAAHLKDEFLANMSHELRTPLNAVLAFSESLLEELPGPLNPRQHESVRHIEAAGRHLLTLINDILDLSKVEAGQLDLQAATLSIAEVCQASLHLVREVAAKKPLTLGFQLNDQLATLHADPRRIKQILVNLLSNAVKFTPAGGQVSLQVTVDPEAGAAQFAVRDTGIGIAAEDLPRLFQPFTQLDSSLSREYEGTGLGLALVRRLVELHGGSITVDSEVGRGSCFTVSLPYQPALPLAPAAPEPVHRPGTGPLRSALVIDDSLTASHQLARHLQESNILTTVIYQGEGAVSKARRLQPDLILLDLMLPDQTGWEVLAQLQADPATRHIPVIIVSVLEARAESRAAGAAAFIEKPVSREALQTVLRSLGAYALPARQAVVITAPPPHAHRLLLAEDNEVNIQALRDYLTAKGLVVAVARDGRQAVEMAEQAPPELILMDIQMPEMDGLEAMRQLRTRPRFATLPIIALTALAMPGDRERCLAAGATDYLTKPVSLKGLYQTITSLLKGT